MGAHRDSFGTLDFLRNLPLFRELDLSELEAVAATATENRVPAGTVLFRRGDPWRHRSRRLRDLFRA